MSTRNSMRICKCVYESANEYGTEKFSKIHHTNTPTHMIRPTDVVAKVGLHQLVDKKKRSKHVFILCTHTTKSSFVRCNTTTVRQGFAAFLITHPPLAGATNSASSVGEVELRRRKGRGV